MSDSYDHKPAALDTARAAQASAEKMADAMKVSELRYRRLFEMARDGILILDSDFGKIADANPFMTELLGYSYDDLVGKELWEIGLLQDKTASQNAFRKLKQDGYLRYEDLPLQNRRGERREVEFVSNLYRENGHTVIQCNIRDITGRKRIQDDLAIVADKNERIAEILQRSMLQASPVGKYSGLDVETLYEAAMSESHVGGDFFDTFALDPQNVALVVGDVSGKGLIAAARTAEVKYALRSFLHEHRAPAVALERLNRFIYDTHLLEDDGSQVFIVLALAVVNAGTGEATFSAAGAEPSVILRADGKSELVNVMGSLIGIGSDATYTARTMLLAPGDTLIMVTDGVTEARRGNNFFGVDGLETLAQRIGPATSLRELTEAIYAGAQDFSRGHLRDDACLLLARRK